MKVSTLIGELTIFLLEHGDREVVTSQKDSETADYTFGDVTNLVDYGEQIGLVGNREEK